MSIDKGAETLALKERTYLVEIFCEAGDDPIIRAHRETVRLDDKGAVVTRARDIAAVERTLTQVADKSFGGISGNDVAAAIMAWADGLRLEDLAAVK